MDEWPVTLAKISQSLEFDIEYILGDGNCFFAALHRLMDVAAFGGASLQSVPQYGSEDAISATRAHVANIIKTTVTHKHFALLKAKFALPYKNTVEWAKQMNTLKIYADDYLLPLILPLAYPNYAVFVFQNNRVHTVQDMCQYDKADNYIVLHRIGDHYNAITVAGQKTVKAASVTGKMLLAMAQK